MVGDRGIKLSGGQKQKILPQEPCLERVILDDEPTNNLDERSCEMFMQLVNNIKFEKIFYNYTRQ